MTEIVLMADPRISALPVVECGEPLVDMRTVAGLKLDPRQADTDGAYAHLRAGLVRRLLQAQSVLPDGIRLLVIEGYRPLALQERYFTEYSARLRMANPSYTDEVIWTNASRYISPPKIAPHVSGAAVDLTLCSADGQELPMGTPVNASPEESDGACYLDAPNISPDERHNRNILTAALRAAGLVNYPTEWWHWSYGDRYWAHTTGAAAACYGPISPV